MWGEKDAQKCSKMAKNWISYFFQPEMKKCCFLYFFFYKSEAVKGGSGRIIFVFFFHSFLISKRRFGGYLLGGTVDIFSELLMIEY